jgi:hypothetical protein
LLDMTNKILVVLGASLALIPLAAQAHDHDGRWRDREVAVRPAPPLHQPDGHYEWRTVNQWVPEHSEAVVVPGECVRRGRHGRRVVCRPSHTEQRWVAGQYVQNGQWVWVANPAPIYPAYGNYAPPAPPRHVPVTPSGFELEAGPGGVRVGIHLDGRLG